MTVVNDANTYLPGTILIPSALQITAMTNSYPMVISVIFNSETQRNTFQEGQLVTLNVPIEYGMFQVNGLQARVISNLNDDITVDIDSRNFDVFTLVSIEGLSPASLTPAGARNLTLDNTTRLVPYQSLNNRGN